MIGLVLENGDLPSHCLLSDGPDVVCQKVEARLRTVLGEWFLDQGVGLPWDDWFGSKTTDPAVISARVRAEVADTPGVASVTSWTFEADRFGAITMEGGFTLDDEDADTIPVRVTMDARNGAIGVIWRARGLR